MKKKTAIYSLLIIISVLRSIETNAQSSSGSPTYNALNFLGWNSTGGPLPFSIGGGATAPLMLLTTSGNFGIGNTFTPVYKLDVTSGDINLNTFTNAYRIGDGSTGNSFPVLWHNGIITNIYVGVGAGSNSTNSTNIHNSFVGNNAGNATTSSRDNTAIGFEALYKNQDADSNVAVGSGALHEMVNPIGGESENTAVGMNALHDNLAYSGYALGFVA